MKTPRLVRGVFFVPDKCPRKCACVGDQLAGDGNLEDAIASKLGSYRKSFKPQVLLDKHEAFVMQLAPLRLNVAVLAGCRILSDSATNPFQIQSFT